MFLPQRYVVLGMELRNFLHVLEDATKKRIISGYKLPNCLVCGSSSILQINRNENCAAFVFSSFCVIRGFHLSELVWFRFYKFPNRFALYLVCVCGGSFIRLFANRRNLMALHKLTIRIKNVRSRDLITVLRCNPVNKTFCFITP